MNTGAIYRFSLESMPSSTDIHVLRALACSGDPSRPPLVSIRTFGYFDVFVDGKPIPFRSEKAKGLLALLVDRRGGFVTSADAIATLWEHEPGSEHLFRGTYMSNYSWAEVTLSELVYG